MRFKGDIPPKPPSFNPTPIIPEKPDYSRFTALAEKWRVEYIGGYRKSAIQLRGELLRLVKELEEGRFK